MLLYVCSQRSERDLSGCLAWLRTVRSGIIQAGNRAARRIEPTGAGHLGRVPGFFFSSLMYYVSSKWRSIHCPPDHHGMCMGSLCAAGHVLLQGKAWLELRTSLVWSTLRLVASTPYPLDPLLDSEPFRNRRPGSVCVCISWMRPVPLMNSPDRLFLSVSVVN
jgi:hypothetical protein